MSIAVAVCASVPHRGHSQACMYYHSRHEKQRHTTICSCRVKKRKTFARRQGQRDGQLTQIWLDRDRHGTDQCKKRMVTHRRFREARLVMGWESLIVAIHDGHPKVYVTKNCKLKCKVVQRESGGTGEGSTECEGGWGWEGVSKETAKIRERYGQDLP